MISEVLLEFYNFRSDHFQKCFHIHDFIWFPDLSVREIRSSLFYKWGAEPHRNWLVCPKSPWISIRAYARRWLSFSRPLFLSQGCLPLCFQCSQRLWHLETQWMPSPLGGPNCLVGKRLWLGHHIPRVPNGRRGDRQNHQAKAEELLIANHPSQPDKEWN